MRYRDHEEWFSQFCEHLQNQMKIETIRELTPSTSFPCIHLEYVPDENCFNRLTGSLSINLMVVFEAHSSPYLQKLQEILGSEILLEKGSAVFKEIKTQKKSDKKIKNTIFDLRYFIKI